MLEEMHNSWCRHLMMMLTTAIPALPSTMCPECMVPRAHPHLFLLEDLTWSPNR